MSDDLLLSKVKLAMQELLQQGGALKLSAWRGNGLDDDDLADCIAEAVSRAKDAVIASKDAEIASKDAVIASKDKELTQLKHAGYVAYMHERLCLMSNPVRCGVVAMQFY